MPQGTFIKAKTNEPEKSLSVVLDVHSCAGDTTASRRAHSSSTNTSGFFHIITASTRSINSSMFFIVVVSPRSLFGRHLLYLHALTSGVFTVKNPLNVSETNPENRNC